MSDKATGSMLNMSALEQLKKRSHSAILYSMLDMLELRDGYTGTHVQQVADYISILVEEMAVNGKWGLSIKDAYIISQSSLLHDLGKIAVPDHLLLKPEKLTPEEFEVIKSHTLLGADSQKKTMMVLGDSDFSQLTYNITRHHHERWDGSGYPDGLKGEEIPLEARITAIADVYDALRSKRPYKDPLDKQETRDIILEERGICFDPDIIKIFLKTEDKFDSYAVETLKKLDD